MHVQSKIACVVMFIIACRLSSAAEPVKPLDTDPLYQLSNLRRGDDNSLMFNVKRTRKASGYSSVFMNGKSQGRIVSITATINPFVEEDIVTLKTFSTASTNAPIDLEIYLVTIHTIGDNKYLYSMVSNPVRIGNPGEATTAREWTSEERQGLAEYQKKAPLTIKRYEVNIAIPANSVKVPLTAQLTKGLKLQACYSSKWNPITALSENADGTVFVRWDEWGQQFDCNMLRDELIIKKTDLARLKKHPESKFPKVPPSLASTSSTSSTTSSTATNAKPLKAYPVSIAIPADSQLIPSDAVLKNGTKLQACYAGKWNPITFLSHHPDGTLTIRWDEYGESFDCRMKREELIIKKALLGKTAERNAQEAVSRVWTDSTGRFKVSAKLLSRSDSTISLLTDAGKTVELPLSRLSQADQTYLATLADDLDNPFE
ncbi:MAG: SHD1 domain-containing protein [Pirellulaceae bacterium]